jgi:hypothetical protein
MSVDRRFVMIGYVAGALLISAIGLVAAKVLDDRKQASAEAPRE